MHAALDDPAVRVQSQGACHAVRGAVHGTFQNEQRCAECHAPALRMSDAHQVP